MFQSSKRRAEPTVYEYNLQATEDVDDHVYPAEEKRRRTPIGKRANYKPTALSWPFIATQIAVLAIVIGLIVWAEKSMPDSDNTAIIDPVPSKALVDRLARVEFGRQFRRDNTSSSSEAASTSTDVQTETAHISATSLTPAVVSTHDPVTHGHGLNTVPETSQSPTSANPEPSVGSSTSTPSTSSNSVSSQEGTGTTGTAQSSRSHSLTTSAEGTSKNDNAFTTSTTQSSGSSVTGTTTSSLPGSSGTDTQTLTNSTTSAANRNGKISIYVDPTATDSTTSFATSIYTSKFTTTAKSSMNITRTITIPEHTTTFNITRSTVITSGVTRTGNATTRPPSTIAVSHTVIETHSSTSVYSSKGDKPSTTVIVSEHSSIVESYTVIPPTTVGSVVVEPTSITSVTVFPTTSEVPETTSVSVVQTYVPYISTGQTVITSVATVVIQPPQTQVQTQAPITVVGTSVVGGNVYTVVETFAPETRVVGANDGAITHVATPPPRTIVSQVGGTVMTTYLVITPTPTTQTVAFSAESTVGGKSMTLVETQGPQTIVRSEDGRLVTLISTPPARTQVTVVGGTLTTVPATSTSSGFKPISYVITTNIGGSTSVVVSTPPATQVVTTIDGTLVTLDATFAPTTYTTTFGGSQVTLTTATTPTGTEPITLTFASTISGSLTTVVQTFPPTTFLTSISGHLSTITTTPSPSTHLSTAPLTTTTFTSTSVPASKTTSGLPSETSIIVTTKTYNLSSREYFTGTFLPPLIAVALMIPLRIIDLNAKLYQPFNSLSSGASGRDAMTLQFTGLMGFITPAVTLMQGRPVPFITTLTVLSASLMVPLAAEAVSLKLHGRCSPLSSHGCAAALGVSPASAHVLLALAGAVALLLALLIFFLRDWSTGLHANPWNIAGIASLSRNPDVRIRAAGGDDDAVRRAVAEKMYALGYYETPDGREEYGLLLADDSGRSLSSQHDAEHTADLISSSQPDSKPNLLPFMTLRYPWLTVFILYLLALLVLIAYYDYTLVHQLSNPTKPLYTSFHLFLDSHSFGIRFLFAGLGVIITFCWQAFFVAVATLIPFHTLSHRPSPPQSSVLLSRPTNPFSGIYLAVRHRHPFYFAVSLAAICSEFLPVLLSNVPHKLTQVLGPTLICTRISMAVLGGMVVVLGWGLWVKWPPMPVDPRSVAGMVWYVCESERLLEDMRGLGEVDGRERDRRVREMGRRYYYGELVGDKGGKGGGRMGVEVHLGLGEGGEEVETGYRSGSGGEKKHGGFEVGVVERQGRLPAGRGGYAPVRTGEDVVRAVLGEREDWDDGDLGYNRRYRG